MENSSTLAGETTNKLQSTVTMTRTMISTPGEDDKGSRAAVLIGSPRNQVIF
jgi:hypothetical protein